MADEPTTEFSTVEFSSDFGALVTSLAAVQEQLRATTDALHLMATSLDDLPTDVKANQIERVDVALTQMEARVKKFVATVLEAKNVSINPEKLVGEIVATIPSLAPVTERLLVAVRQATGDFADELGHVKGETKAAFEPQIVTNYTRSIKALEDRLKIVSELERNLAVWAQKGKGQPDYASIRAEQYLKQGSAMTGMNVAGMTPQDIWKEEGAGGTTRAEKMTAKLGEYRTMLTAVKDAQEVVKASIQGLTAQQGTELSSLAQLNALTQERRNEIGGLQATITRLNEQSSQLATTDDTERGHVEALIETAKRRIAVLREEITALNNRAVAVSKGREGSFAETIAKEAPWHPSELLHGAQEMTSSMLKNYLEKMGQDPRLVDALVGATKPSGITAAAANWGTQMHARFQTMLQDPKWGINAGFREIETSFKGLDKAGKEWSGRGDWVDMSHNIITDFKAVGQSTFQEISAYASGAKDWSSLTDQAKQYLAQLEAYRRLYQSVFGKETAALRVMKLPTMAEVGTKPGQFPTAEAGLENLMEQLQGKREATSIAMIGPEKFLTEEQWKQVEATTQENRLLATQSTLFQTLAEYVEIINQRKAAGGTLDEKAIRNGTLANGLKATYAEQSKNQAAIDKATIANMEAEIAAKQAAYKPLPGMGTTTVEGTSLATQQANLKYLNNQLTGASANVGIEKQHLALMSEQATTASQLNSEAYSRLNALKAQVDIEREVYHAQQLRVKALEATGATPAKIDAEKRKLQELTEEYNKLSGVMRKTAGAAPSGEATATLAKRKDLLLQIKGVQEAVDLGSQKSVHDTHVAAVRSLDALDKLMNKSSELVNASRKRGITSEEKQSLLAAKDALEPQITAQKEYAESTFRAEAAAEAAKASLGDRTKKLAELKAEYASLGSEVKKTTGLEEVHARVLARREELRPQMKEQKAVVKELEKVAIPKGQYQAEIQALATSKERLTVATQEADVARAAYKDSETTLEVARQKVVAQEASVAKAEQELQSTNAQLEAQKAVVGQMEAEVSLRAKAAGVAEAKAARPDYSKMTEGDLAQLRENALTMQQVTAEGERQVAMRVRAVGVAKEDLAATRTNKELKENDLQTWEREFIQRESAVDKAQQELAVEKEIQKQNEGILRTVRSRVEQQELLARAAEKGALGAIGAPADVTTKMAAAVQAVQQAAPGEERKKALADLKAQEQEVDKLVGSYNKARAALELTALSQRAARQEAELTAKAAAQAATAATAKVTLAAKGKVSAEELGVLSEEAKVLDTVAVAEERKAQATRDAEAATRGSIDVNRAETDALKNLNKDARATGQQFKEAGSATSSWVDKLFSLRKVVTVFWGTLMSQVAYGAMNAIQTFFANSIQLAITAEAAIRKYEIAVRSTQRSLAEGFPGAPKETIGDFAGTIDEWSKSIDAFAKKWDVFTKQNIRLGFKEIMSVTRSANLGKALEDQLAEVAAMMAMVESEFGGDIVKASSAVANAVEGYTRTMRGTFINMIDSVDQDIMAVKTYGKTYAELGGANEELKKHQQSLVNTYIILERFKSAQEDIGAALDTMEAKQMRANAKIAESQTIMGKSMAPAWIKALNAVAGAINGIVGAYEALIKVVNEVVLIEYMAIGGQKNTAKILKENTKLTDEQRKSMERWVQSSILLSGLEGRDLVDVKGLWADIGDRIKNNTLEVILYKEAVQEGNIEVAKGYKAQLAARLALARAEESEKGGKGRVALLEKSIKEINTFTKGLGDADVAAQLLTDTLGAGVEDLTRLGIKVPDIVDKIKDAEEDREEKLAELAVSTGEERAENWFDYLDSVETAWQDHEDNLVEMAKDAADKIVEAEEKAAEDALEAWDTWQDAIEKENADYADRLAEEGEKKNDDAEKAAREHQQKLEELEIEHLRKLRDIQAQYEYDVTEAAGQRDARRVLELMRKHEFDVSQEGVSYQDRIDDENRRFAQREEERKKEEEDNRAKLEREHLAKLEELKEAYDKRLKEIEKALAKEKVTIEEDLVKKAKEEGKRLDKQLEDLKENYSKREKAITKSYEKQVESIEDGFDKQIKAIIKGLNKTVEITENRLHLLEAAVAAALGPDGYVTRIGTQWAEWWDALLAARSVISAPAMPGGGTETPAPEPTTPIPPSTSHAPGAGETEEARVAAAAAAMALPASVLPGVFNQRQTLDINITADEHFSIDFEDRVLNAVAEALRGD